MRYKSVLLTIALVAILPRLAVAQAAHVGRLPVLELPPAGVGSCNNDPVSAELQHAGIARLVSFRSSDSTAHRLISLAMSASGGVVMLSAMMRTDEAQRGETESVYVLFGTNGTIANGRRDAFTGGAPARVGDDRHLGLLATDTLAVRRLAAALRERCRA